VALYRDCVATGRIYTGQVWMDSGAINDDFHAKQLNNGLDVIRVHKIMSQSMEMLYAKV
jgi:hypothetical protein